MLGCPLGVPISYYTGFFFRFRVAGTKKSSENDQMTGHFESFFVLISPEQTVILVK